MLSKLNQRTFYIIFINIYKNKQMSDNMTLQSNIIEYFIDSNDCYIQFGSDSVDKPYALHYGFYKESKESKEPKTALLNHFQSLDNMRDSIITDLNIEQYKKTSEASKERIKILDAGCGTGNISTYIAQHYDVDVYGISIVPLQISEANKYSKDLKNVHYNVEDFTNTSFSDNFFDRVFFIESACYAQDKDLLFKEVYRIMKPDAELLIYDHYIIEPTSSFDKDMYNIWLTGWALKTSIRITDLYLFQRHICRDITDNIMPSSKFIRDICQISILYGTGTNRKPLKDESEIRKKHIKAGIAQYYLFNSIMSYGIFHCFK